MKIVRRAKEVNSSNLLKVSFDVGKKNLNWVLVMEDATQIVESSDCILNRSSSIHAMFDELEELAEANGYDGLSLCCEPTGGFERLLLRSAHARGHQTSYVSPESVQRMGIVEGNDPTKSDKKDPRVIHLLHAMGKTITCRVLPAEYQELREWSGFYEDLTDRNVELRNLISSYLYRLFPDFDLSPKVLYQATGKAIMAEFQFNPYLISAVSHKAFLERIKRHCKRPKLSNVEAIYQAAIRSRKHVLPESLINAYQEQLSSTCLEWKLLDERRYALKGKMIGLLKELPEAEKLHEFAEHFSLFLLARVIAETGPLSDFRTTEQLLKYAGVNLCMRQSGKYLGQIKISKRGRPLLRKVLYQIVNTHLTRDSQARPGLYLDYYRKKLGRVEMPAEKDLPKGIHYKARTCVMRKFLAALLGVYRSPMAFSPERLRACESQAKAS